MSIEDKTIAPERPMRARMSDEDFARWEKALGPVAKVDGLTALIQAFLSIDDEVAQGVLIGRYPESMKPEAVRQWVMKEGGITVRLKPDPQKSSRRTDDKAAG